MKQHHNALSPYLLLIFFLCVSFTVSAQEESTETSLFDKTLFNDISTASYYELLNWCRELELNTKGDSIFLKNQLYRFYSVDVNSTQRETDNSGAEVKIITADRSEYFTLEDIEEDYVRISGRVKLIVRQNPENINHTIEADSVLFNQSENTMTASGNILYTKEENGNTEEYTGDNFTFNVKSWKGVILNGDFQKSQEVGNQEMDFTFRGEAIKKGEGDVIVLDEGSITSSEAEDPYYQIKASKIWILGPDEWAILNGALYLGHVPMLYIPFYHLPGNDLFFNPVIGNESRRGYFIQTTSYLLGEKSASEEDDTFFINLADSDESYNLVPEGMYLFKERGEPEETNSDYIKYKLDYYSQLGAYTAIEGSIGELWEFKKINFNLDIGVTKSLYSSNGYTNYFEENNYEAAWNTTDLYGIALPFRWAAALGFTIANFSLSLEYMTDPYFISDFSTRSEDFDWLNYLLAQTTEEENISTSSKNALSWSLQGSLRVPTEKTAPYLRVLNFSPLKMNLIWSSKDTSEIPGNDPYSPTNKFFYPDNITWAQTNLNLSGIVLEKSSGKYKLDPVRGGRRSSSLRTPWNDDNQEEPDAIESERSEDSYNKSEILQDITIESDGEDFYTKIDYSASSYFNFLSYLNTEEWAKPADVDFSILKSLLTNNNTLNLNYQVAFWDRKVSLSGKNSFTGNYLDYFGDISDNEASRELYSRKMKWGNVFDFKFTPFKDFEHFSGSTVSYDFDTTLFNYTYDREVEEYDSHWIEWIEDDITAHKASVKFDFKIPVLHTSVTFDTTLPPQEIEQTINPLVELNFFNWTNKVNGKIIYKDEEWKLDPFTYISSFVPLEWLNLSSTLTYSFEEETFTSFVGKLKIWEFSGSYNMSYTTDYEWDLDTEQYISNDKAFVPSSAALSFSHKIEIPPLWKNRIKMGGNISSALTMNLQQYNRSSLSFKLDYNLEIFEFLDLQFTLNSSNKYMFLYFSPLREYYGIEEEYNFFTDLLKSFNFFSEDQIDRKESFFNMDLLKFTMTHKLGDWDLQLSYSGKPEINTSELITKWDSTFSVLVRWNPIEQLKVKTSYEDELWNIDTEFE